MNIVKVFNIINILYKYSDLTPSIHLNVDAGLVGAYACFCITGHAVDQEIWNGHSLLLEGSVSIDPAFIAIFLQVFTKAAYTRFENMKYRIQIGKLKLEELNLDNEEWCYLNEEQLAKLTGEI